MTFKQYIISFVIILVLGAQMSTFATGSVIWPFYTYCMYSWSWPHEHIFTNIFAIEGVTHDGKSVPLSNKDVSLPRFFFTSEFLIPLAINEDEKRYSEQDRLATWDDLMTRLRKTHGDEFKFIVVIKTRHEMVPQTTDNPRGVRDVVTRFKYEVAGEGKVREVIE